MENDKLIAEAEAKYGIRTYGSKLWKQATTAYRSVTGLISKSTLRGNVVASFVVKGTVKQMFVPLAPGIPATKESYDLVEFIAERDGGNSDPEKGPLWSVKAGKVKLFAM